MQANPNKFQYILFGASDECRLQLTGDIVLNAMDSVKLLGMDIDKELNFAAHIGRICKKAGKQLHVLRRLPNTLATHTKLTLFRCYVLSNFTFCSTIWHFCNMSDSRKMEKLQKQALRLVFTDYTSSYAELRQRADVPLLYINRIRNEMIDVFKIVSQGNGPIYLRKLFKASEHRYNTRSILSLELPKYRTVKYGRNCFKFHGAKLWNSLDTSFKCAIHLQSFKEPIRSWNGQDCKCQACDLCLLKLI